MDENINKQPNLYPLVIKSDNILPLWSPRECAFMALCSRVWVGHLSFFSAQKWPNCPTSWWMLMKDLNYWPLQAWWWWWWWWWRWRNLEFSQESSRTCLESQVSIHWVNCAPIIHGTGSSSRSTPRRMGRNICPRECTHVKTWLVSWIARKCWLSFMHLMCFYFFSWKGRYTIINYILLHTVSLFHLIICSDRYAS